MCIFGNNGCSGCRNGCDRWNTRCGGCNNGCDGSGNHSCSGNQSFRNGFRNGFRRGYHEGWEDAMRNSGCGGNGGCNANGGCGGNGSCGDIGIMPLSLDSSCDSCDN